MKAHILDHGHVELVDYMGTDLSVVNAARVSFEKQSKLETFMEDVGDEGTDVVWKYKLSDRDVRLIRFLAKHKHWTPFAHTSLTYRIKAPLFVARQLGKHQVGLVWNEVSRRYVDSPPQFYSPEWWRARPEESIKQGSIGYPVRASSLLSFNYEKLVSEVRALYRELLDAGVAPEQARMVLPQSMYTEWMWTGSLAAFARVYNLRKDPHAQYETQLYAKAISAMLPPGLEHSWEALTGENPTD